MSDTIIKINAAAKSLAQQMRLPDYFFSGEIGFACGSLDAFAVDWGQFSEARVSEDRIVVLHAKSEHKEWLLSDYVTGVRITSDRTKAAVWRKLATLPGWSNKLGDYPSINTRPFISAYLSVVALVKNASPVARQAMLCACRDIANNAVDIDG